MSELSVLFSMRLRAARNQLFRTLERERFKVAVIVLMGGALWLILFDLFYLGFRHVGRQFNEQSDLPIIFGSLFSLFFLTLFLMLTFSNAIIALGSLFRAEETRFLLATPTPAATVYLYRLSDSLLFSSWATLVLGLPVMLAYGLAAKVGPLYYLGLVLYFPPFILLCAALGTLLALLLTLYFPRTRRQILVVSGLLFALAAGYLFLSSLPTGHGYRLLGALESVLRQLEFSQHLFLPSYWTSRGLLAAGTGDWREAGLFLALLVATTLFFLELGRALAARRYPAAYSLAAAHARSRRFPARGGPLDRLVERLDPLWPGAPRMMLKDLRGFLRDPTQWGQGAIFFGILAVYFMNIPTFYKDLSNVFWKLFISFLNLTAILLTLTTLATRFVYPLFSLEGRRFWILGLAPLPRRRLVLAKFVYCLAGTLLVAEPMVFLSNLMLRGDEPHPADNQFLLIQAATVAALCLALSGLIVGLGVLFPAFGETNPSKIVSGFGGTLVLVLTVSLVLTIIAAEWVPCHFYWVAHRIRPGQYRLWIGLTLVGVGALAVLAASLPLALAARALRRLEF